MVPVKVLLRSWLVGAAALFAILPPMETQAADRIGDFLARHLREKQVPGCAVIVRHKGKTFCKGYGMANLEHQVPVTPQTVFQSGSIGKQFTAMAILLLAEEGKLALTDPVSKYLAVPETWKGITVRHLLSHTAGLGDYPEDFSLTKDYTEEDLLKMITDQPLHSAPGEKWNYSNLGYVTLGILMHKVTGKFYGDFLQERIFRPLEMTSTRIINEREIIPHRAAGYRLREGRLGNQDWVAPSVNTTADGSLYLTAEDMAKWAEALDQEKLLSHVGYEEMWSPAKLNDGSAAPYGYGWGIGQTKSGHRVLEHGGAWQGFASFMARYPDDDLTVAVLCNRAGAPARYIAQHVAGFEVPALAPPEHKAARIDPSILQIYAGEYRLEDRFTVTVKAVGDHLEMKWLGENVAMVPESETEFFEEGHDRTYRFAKDTGGEITALVISVPEELTLRKVPTKP